jgi:hypothetical protein
MEYESEGKNRKISIRAYIKPFREKYKLNPKYNSVAVSKFS